MATETYEVPIMTDGEHLHHMFEAVATITGADGLMGSLENMVAVIGVLVVTLMVALRGNWQAVMQWLLVYVCVWSVLVVPKVTVNVLDRSNPAVVGTEPVSGVPLGLGVPVSFATRIGDRIASIMETALQIPNDFSYSSGRLMWGPELFETSLSFEVTDAVARENMENYLSACVLPRTVSVPDYRSEVRNETEILTLLGSDAPSNRLVQVRDPATGALASKVCSDAVSDVTSRFTASVDSEMKAFAQRMYPALSPDDALAELLVDLSRGSEQFIGVSKAGSEYLRQVALIRAMRHSVAGYSQDPGASALIGYVEGKSEAQATLTMAALGSLMQDSLPRIYTITLILLIAIFPIIVFMAMLPGMGLSTLKVYFGSFVYIQAFGILFVVINSIIVNDQILAGQALALGPTGSEKGISLANYGMLRDMPSQISATASMLLMSIPALSAIFTKGAMGVGQSIQSSLRPLEKAAETAATEASSGNINTGNASVNMVSQNQATGFKLDTNTVGRTGMSTIQQANGAVVRRMRAGGSVVDTSQARGNFATSGSVQSATSEEVGRRINAARTRQRTAAQTLSDSRNAASEQSASMFMSLVRGDTTMKELGISETSEEGRALTRSLNQAQSYNENNSTQFSDAITGKAYAGGAVKASGGLKVFGNGATVEGEVGTKVEGSMGYTHSTNAQASDSNQENIGASRILREGSSALERAAASQSFAATSTAGINLKKSVADVQSAQKSYNDATTDLTELSRQQSRVDSLSASQATDISQLAYTNYAAAQGGGEAGLQAAEALFSNTSDADALREQRQALGAAGLQYLEGIRPDTRVTPFSMTREQTSQNLAMANDVYASGVARMNGDITAQYGSYAASVADGNGAALTAQGLGVDLDAAKETMAVRSALIGAQTLEIPNASTANIGLNNGGFDTVYGRDPGQMVTGDLREGTHAQDIGSPIAAGRGEHDRDGTEFGPGSSTRRENGAQDNVEAVGVGLSAIGQAAVHRRGAPFGGLLTPVR